MRFDLLVLTLVLGLVYMNDANAKQEAMNFYLGPQNTVRVDGDGKAYVIGMREQKSSYDDFRFRSTPDLDQVKKVVVGYNSIWFLRTNGEIWRMGFRAESYAPDMRKASDDNRAIESRDPKFFAFKPEKINLPLMADITGTGARVGGITQSGEAWFWGQRTDFGADFNQAKGAKINFGSKRIKRLIFDEYEQTIIEDEDGQLWGRPFVNDRVPQAERFEKMSIPKQQALMATGHQIVATQSGSELHFYSYYRSLGTKASRQFTSEKQIDLPASKGKLFIVDKKIVFLSDEGSVYELPFEHYGEDLRLQAWKKREFSEAIKKIWIEDNHEIFQTVSGRLFATGKNDVGELGFPFTFDRPTLNSHVGNAVSFAVAEDATLVVNKEGKLITWGSGGILGEAVKEKVIPGEVNCPPLQSVDADRKKGLGVTKTGDVYIWGYKSQYVPSSQRNFFVRNLLSVFSKHTTAEFSPIKVDELKNIDKAERAYAKSYDFTGRAIDDQNQIWVWKEVDLSNPFESLFTSFVAPYVWRKLGSDEVDAFRFDYSGVLIVKKDGSLWGEKNQYAFRIKGVTFESAGGSLVRFDLPPIKKVLPLSDESAALLFKNGDVGYLTSENFKIIEKDVKQIFNGDELLILKHDGTLVEGEKAKQILKFTSNELVDIDQIRKGRSHYIMSKKDGSIWVWGANDKGQLGLVNSGPALTPRLLDM